MTTVRSEKHSEIADRRKRLQIDNGSGRYRTAFKP